MKVQFFSLLTILFLSACAVPKQPVSTPFAESEFAAYKGPGTSTITGQAFLKTRGGEVKFGAGNEVVLVPVTDYTREITQKMVAGIPTVKDPRYMAYRRTAVADGNGNFEFRNIPAGDYYLSCAIHWEVPGAYGANTTGSIAMGKATVHRGESIKVVLTR